MAVGRLGEALGLARPYRVQLVGYFLGGEDRRDRIDFSVMFSVVSGSWEKLQNPGSIYRKPGEDRIRAPTVKYDHYLSNYSDV